MAPARLPPHARMPGPIHWLRENLFSSWLNAALTIAAVALILWIVVPFFQWTVLDATWQGADREACLAHNGACWPFIAQRAGQIVYGFYDVAERWRVDIALILLAAGL